GRCGSRMDDSVTERALVCPSCGLTVYPRINPAVIVGVVHGDSLLVTHYRGRPYRHLALVAGFSEIGESCEDTVRREVREETGIDVGSVLFYKSQPWPISDSLLMGFFAEADNPGKIAVQETELSEAHWCPRDQLPVGSGFSLTEEMMDRFRTAGSPF
ncbi:MAG: NAD(+) diphosphatase, partial [Oscillospiraceae bacterium]